jgi:hypothetical protein
MRYYTVNVTLADGTEQTFTQPSDTAAIVSDWQSYVATGYPKAIKVVTPATEEDPESFLYISTRCICEVSYTSTYEADPARDCEQIDCIPDQAPTVVEPIPTP